MCECEALEKRISLDCIKYSNNSATSNWQCIVDVLSQIDTTWAVKYPWEPVVIGACRAIADLRGDSLDELMVDSLDHHPQPIDVVLFVITSLDRDWHSSIDPEWKSRVRPKSEATLTENMCRWIVRRAGMYVKE